MRDRLRLVLTLLGVGLGVVLAARQPPAPPPVSMRVPVPPALVAMAGFDSMLYELHLENRGEFPVTLTRIDLQLDPTPLTLRVDGEQLTRMLDVPPDRAAPHRLLPGTGRVAYVDMRASYSNGVRVRPSRLRHRLRFALPDGTEVVSDDGEGIAVDPRPPAVLGPPLSGGPWAAVHHPDWPRGHRRVFYTVDGVTRLPGRHTIDFVKLDVQGRSATGDSDLVASALGYGAPVLAVADATVAAARDDMPEPSRVSARVKHPQHDAAGNFVSLGLGSGRFAVYEHLRPGSVTVKAGQAVRRGDVIAQLGFTGDSTGPHLHLHVGDAPSPLGAEGQPWVLDRFAVLGRYADLANLGKAPWRREGVGQVERERPAPNVVVDFGPAINPR